MRIAFIGGLGHNFLYGQIDPAGRYAVDAIAWAGDGYDGEAAKTRAAACDRVKWFDDANQMLDTFGPDVVNVGAMYGHMERRIQGV